MQSNNELLANFTTKIGLIWDIFTRRTSCAKFSLRILFLRKECKGEKRAQKCPFLYLNI
jgi:hypothetical protein